MGGGMGGRSKYGSPNPKVEEELKRPRRGILLRLGKYLWQMKWFLLLALGLTIGGNTFSLLGPTLSGKAIDCIGTQAGGVDFAGVLHYALLMVLFVAGLVSLAIPLLVLALAAAFLLPVLKGM